MSASKLVATRDLEIPRWSCERVHRECGCQHCASCPKKGGFASIAAPSGILASGGPVDNWSWYIGGVPSGSPIGDQCSFRPGGPRIQGGCIVPTAKGTGQADARSATRGAAPTMSVLRLFRFIPPRTVPHQMDHHHHHHQREQVVGILFNLRKMDGYQVERLKRMFTRLNILSQWWSLDCQMMQLPAENGQLLF